MGAVINDISWSNNTLTSSARAEFQRSEQDKDVATGVIFYWISTPENLAEKEFKKQRQAFRSIPPLLLSEYQGEFVVSHDGQILDHDHDLPTLTARFFSKPRNFTVYIAQVAPTMPERVVTPSFR